MKRVRWKSRYLTGRPDLDVRNRALVGLLDAFSQELSRKEHCQDMNAVYDDLASLAGERLEEDPASLATAGASGYAAVEGLLKTRFPLAALSTPACKECGLCDLLQDRIRGWLADTGGGEGSD
jgi:hypothetical protein